MEEQYTKKVRHAIKEIQKGSSQELYLNGSLLDKKSKIDDEGIKEIFECLKFNTTVIKIYLNSNMIGNQGAKWIGECLKFNHALTSIFLSSNMISNEGMKYIEECLKFNHTLTFVDLSFNMFQNVSKQIESLTKENYYSKGQALERSLAHHFLDLFVHKKSISKLEEAAIFDKFESTDQKQFLQNLEEIFCKNIEGAADKLKVDFFLLKNNIQTRYNKLKGLQRSIVQNNFEGTVKLYNQEDSNPFIRDANGQSLLHVACQTEGIDANIIKFLLEKNASPNAKDVKGRTPLHVIFFNKINAEIVKMLLDFGADQNIKDKDGKAPIHIAASNENLDAETLNMLLEKGDPNLLDDSGKSSLHLLCLSPTSMNIHVVNLLIEKGAILTIKDNQSKNVFDYLKERKSQWKGEIREDKQWNGTGTCFWKDKSGEEWIFEGSLQNGNPIDGVTFMIQFYGNEKRTMEAEFRNGKRFGEGILTEKRKQFIVEFDQQGEEIVSNKRRPFEGMKLIFIGDKNVGKTTFKKRLISAIKDSELKNLFVKVIPIKKEEETTHGAEIETFEENKNMRKFLIFDLAGTEEYRPIHSYFFSSAAIYFLFIDCSIDFKKLEFQESVLYWLNVIHSQLGKNTRVVIVGTKIDILQNKNKSVIDNGKNLFIFCKLYFLLICETKGVSVRNHRLNQINKVIQKILSDNDIELQILTFKFNTKSDFVFFPLNYKESSKFGLLQLYELFSNEYDKTDAGASILINFKHKIVFDHLQQLFSKTQTNVEIDKKPKPSFNIGIFNRVIASNNSNEKQFQIKISNPFTTVSEIKEMLKSNYIMFEKEKDDDLAPILEDLNNLGVLVLLKNIKDHEESVVIDTKWFCDLFTVLFAYGRKRLESLVEKIYLDLKKLEKETPKKINKNDKENSLKQCENILRLLNTKNAILGDQNNKMQDFWKNQEKKKSHVDKISFHEFSKKVDLLEKKLIEEKNQFILEEFKENPQKAELILNQLLCFISREQLSSILDEIILNRTEEQQVVQFLIKLGIVFPSAKRNYKAEKKFQNNLFIPVLFPPSIPKKIRIFEGGFKLAEISRKNEVTMTYDISFVNSPFWIFIFQKIRDSLVKEGRIFELIDEFYWKNGFVINFQSKEEFLQQLLKSSSIIKLEIVCNDQNKDRSEYALEFLIKTNGKPQNLTSIIHQEMNDFVLNWIKPNFLPKIKLRIEEKHIKAKKQSLNASKCAFCGLEVCLRDKLDQCDECKQKEDNVKGNCFNCSKPILITKNTKQCKNCKSKNFLLANEFVFHQIVFQGEKKIIYRAEHLTTGIIVAIKERIQEDPEYLDCWEREIKSWKLVLEKVPDLKTSRFICCLDDSVKKIQQKYIINEWIEGKNLSELEEEKLKTTSFNCEIDFLNMMISLLNDLRQIHDQNIFHSTIKMETIMWTERDDKLNFMFVDFKDSVLINDKSLEKNFKNDVYCLGKIFQELLRKNSAIKLGSEIEQVINEMIMEDLSKRPTSEDCVNRLASYSNEFNIQLDLSSSLSVNKLEPNKKQSMLTNNKSMIIDQKLEINSKGNPNDFKVDINTNEFAQREDDEETENQLEEERIEITDQGMEQFLRREKQYQRQIAELQEKLKQRENEIQQKNKDLQQKDQEIARLVEQMNTYFASKRPNISQSNPILKIQPVKQSKNLPALPPVKKLVEQINNIPINNTQHKHIQDKINHIEKQNNFAQFTPKESQSQESVRRHTSRSPRLIKLPPQDQLLRLSNHLNQKPKQVQVRKSIKFNFAKATNPPQKVAQQSSNIQVTKNKN